jgi:S-adenosylmethionine:tRNA ribosyltransferase-isomerase
MNLKDYDFELPEELIAAYPIEKRDNSKLLVCKKNTAEKNIKQFHDIIDELDENMHLVFNDAKVLQARLFGSRKSGGKFEVLLNRALSFENNTWEVIGKNIKKVKEGEIIYFGDDLNAEMISKESPTIIKFNKKFSDFDKWLQSNGHIPLPPYILRKRDSHQDEEIDKIRYQTVYAKNVGAVAAPTAGLHFTDELLQKIKEKNISSSKVTLYVGLGTFMPIKTDEILNHHMHFETYSITKETAQEINEAKKQGKKIISVGTTSLRTLEAVANEDGTLEAREDETDLFVYPGYKFKIVDGLITNYHLPKSTLLLLVSALHGKDNLFEAYDYAIKNNFRFYSYGDSMFIKP